MKNIAIERLRGVAILFTVWAHLPFVNQHVWKGLTQTWSGVDLFFVISGYVVSRSFIRLLDAHTLRDACKVFYIRRICRILPLAFLWMVIPLAIVSWMGQTTQLGRSSYLIQEIEALFLLKYNYAISHQTTSYLIPYWSLTVEEHFYLMVPWLLILWPTSRARKILSIAGIFIVCVILRPWVSFHGNPALEYHFYRFASHCKFDALFAGIFLGALSGSERPATPSRKVLWHTVVCGALVGLCLFPSLLPFQFMGRSGSILLWICGGIAVWAASRDETLLNYGPLGKALELLGACSYAIYLSHFFMIKSLDLYIARNPASMLTHPVLYFLAASAAILLVVYPSHKIEYWFISFGKKVTQRTVTSASLQPEVISIN